MRLLTAATAIVLAAGTAPSEESPPIFEGQVTVRRIVAAVRVLDPKGEPILGLGPADFRVELAGRPAEIESVEWITTDGAVEAGPTEAGAEEVQETGPPAPSATRGRLLVLLIQTDLESVRLTGLFRMAHPTAAMLDTFGPNDRVALAVYSKHLDLVSDFTPDIRGMKRLLTVPMMLGHRPIVEPGQPPSLAAHFDREAAAAAASPSAALQVLGRALQPIPGPKTVIMLAWGLGTHTAHGVVLGADFHAAIDALVLAETSVFVLDIIDADSHSLEVGLKTIARRTGGRYERTNIHPEVAVELILRALRGHYELVLVPAPDVLASRLPLEVEVDRARAEVLAPPYLALPMSAPEEPGDHPTVP